MNIITKNMNTMNTNCSKHIKKMDIQTRGGTKIMSNHGLDKIRNPSEACLPLSRSNLARYALEWSSED
jgi:hypothetical protein